MKGTPPPGRSDMEIVFDSKHGQLAVFGGYGSEWWDDMWLLDVSAMVIISEIVLGKVKAVE